MDKLALAIVFVGTVVGLVLNLGTGLIIICAGAGLATWGRLRYR